MTSLPLPSFSKSCLCGYVGDDFGRDASQLDGLNRSCRPCVRAQAARKNDYTLGSVPSDAWRLEHGYAPAQKKGSGPDAAELAGMFTRPDPFAELD